MMDQPLDLSQRDQEMNGIKMETEETYCQYVNCACPLRHISPIESQHSGYIGPIMGHINPMRYLPGFYTEAMMFEPNMTNFNSKRNSATDIRYVSVAQPKKRKLDQLNHTVSRSASDESLTSLSSPPETFLLSSPPQTFFRPGFPEEDKEPFNTTQQNKVSENGFKTPERGSPVFQIGSNVGTEIKKETDITESNLTKDERIKTSSYMERLPKKKYWARHFSQEKSEKTFLKSSIAGPVINAHDSKSHIPGSDVTCSSQKREESQFDNVVLQNQEDSSSSSSSSSSLSSFKSESDTLSQMNYPLTDEQLKADMIREIDDSNEQEVTSQKKPSHYLFRAMPDSAKVQHSEDTIKPGGCRITALDYLISKTLLQKEDKPYKARNNHIHQILRGEKPGKLCLMDIVELQVEIGLA